VESTAYRTSECPHTCIADRQCAVIKTSILPVPSTDHRYPLTTKQEPHFLTPLVVVPASPKTPEPRSYSSSTAGPPLRDASQSAAATNKKACQMPVLPPQPHILGPLDIETQLRPLWSHTVVVFPMRCSVPHPIPPIHLTAAMAGRSRQTPPPDHRTIPSFTYDVPIRLLTL
jgi:hypothetical protein